MPMEKIIYKTPYGNGDGNGDGNDYGDGYGDGYGYGYGYGYGDGSSLTPSETTAAFVAPLNPRALSATSTKLSGETYGKITAGATASKTGNPMTLTIEIATRKTELSSANLEAALVAAAAELGGRKSIRSAGPPRQLLCRRIEENGEPPITLTISLDPQSEPNMHNGTIERFDEAAGKWVWHATYMDDAAARAGLPEIKGGDPENFSTG